MTRDARFIQQIESYLDEYEGVTTLPDRVRNAIRAELPKTRQAGALRGPARYLSMMSTRTAQIALALAAAALIVAVGAFLYSGRNVGAPDASPSPSTDPAPGASGSASAGCEATMVASSGLGATVLDVTWCAYGLGDPRTIAFSMEGSFEVGSDQFFPGQGTLWLRPSGGGAITLALFEGQAVDEVLAEVSAREGYAVANETAITLDGAGGTVVDLRLAEGATSSDVEPLIADNDQTWRLQDGTLSRVWLVDRSGDTLMIAAGEDLADAVGDALGTLQWAE